MVHRLSRSSDIISWQGLDAVKWTLLPNVSIINDKQGISHMVNKAGAVKKGSFHNKVTVGLMLNGELGKLNLADKKTNGLCARSTKRKLLILHP